MEKLFGPLDRKWNNLKEGGNHVGLRLPLSSIQSQKTKEKCTVLKQSQDDPNCYI